MKRRFWVWIAFAALALRVVMPVAAYAAAQPTPGFNELCSASGQASSFRAAPPGEPAAPSTQHLLAHCTDCPCCAVAAPLPAAFGLPLYVAGSVIAPPIVAAAATAAALELYPPPRGPPSRRRFA